MAVRLPSLILWCSSDCIRSHARAAVYIVSVCIATVDTEILVTHQIWRFGH